MQNRGTTESAGRQRGAGALRAAPPMNAAQRVYDDLRERIIHFDLPPETTLSRQDLAAVYEVSQTPVREAILRLGEEGLVRIYPQSRTIVSKIDIPQLREAHFLRVSVETEVVRHLALRGGDVAVRDAAAILAEQRTLAEIPSAMERFTELDDAFHESLFRAVNQTGLFHMLKAKTGHLARLRRLDLPSKGKFAAILEAHAAIVAAISAGDEAAAAAAMRHHLTGTISSIDALVEANPAYFSP